MEASSFEFSDDVVARLRACEDREGRRWLEKELTRLLHLWQGTSRTSFAQDRRPPWWSPGKTITVGEVTVVIPRFQSRKKGGWTADVMRSLIACAYESMEGLVHPEGAAAEPMHKPTAGTWVRKGVILDASVLEVNGTDRSAVQVPDESTLQASQLTSEEGHIVPDPAEERRVPDVEPAPPVVEKTQLEDALQELDLEVESRCQALDSAAERIVLSLETTYKLEILKLPKKVRNMSIRQFYDKYAGDIDSVLMQNIRQAVERSIAMEFRRSSEYEQENAGSKRRRARAENAAAEGLATGRVRRTRSRTKEALKDASNTYQSYTSASRGKLETAHKAARREDALLRTPAADVPRAPVSLFAEPRSAIRSIRRGANGRTRIELDDGQEVELTGALGSSHKSLARGRLLAIQSELQQLLSELDD